MKLVGSAPRWRWKTQILLPPGRRRQARVSGLA